MAKDTGKKKGSLLDSLREIVFGLEDGVVSTLGALTGMASGTQNGTIVIISGFVIIFVESLSMGAGTYLSNKSEHELDAKTIRDIKKQIAADPETQRKRLRGLFAERGYTEAELDVVVSRTCAHPDLWAEEIAMKELHVIPEREVNHVKDGLLMGGSYVAGGLIPLIAYFVLPISIALPISIGASVIGLFLIGFTKGRLVHINPLKSGVEMMTVSIAAAAVGFVVGRLAGMAFGVEF